METKPQMATSSKAEIEIQIGELSQSITAGERQVIKAQPDTHYRITERLDDKKSLLDDVVAKKSGDDLILSYADGTEVALQGYFEVCKSDKCSVTLPSDDVEGYLIEGDATKGVSLDANTSLLYAHGSSESLMGLAQGNRAMQNTFGELQGSVVTYEPEGGMSMGALGGIGGGLAVGGLAGGGAGGGSSAATVSSSLTFAGSVVAGPVLEGHGLTVTAYKASGAQLGNATVKADGTYQFTYNADYSGPVLIRVTDNSSGNDYMDEATGVAKDLTSDLRAVVNVNGSGTYSFNITPLTELAVRELGLTSGDGGDSAILLGGISSAQVNTANQQVAEAFGLTGTNIVTGSIQTTVNVSGGAQASNAYGEILAAISGMEQGANSSTDALLQNLSDALTGTTLSETSKKELVAGALSAGLNSASAQAVAASVGIDSVAFNNFESAWNAIKTSADGVDNNATNPTQAQYLDLGVVGIDTAAEQSLVGDVLDITPFAAVDSVAELQVLADAVQRVMDTASATPNDASLLEALQALGIVDVSADNLTFVETAIAATLADGTEIDTLAELQAVVSSVAPSVLNIEITSATDSQNNLLNAGDVVSVTVTMSEYTIVDVGVGTPPQLKMNVGGDLVQADYVSGSASQQLIFNYTILAGQTDINGISIDAGSLILNGGALKDANGNLADLTYTAVSDNDIYKVDTTASITISPIALDDIINTVEDDGMVTIHGTTTNVEDGQEVTVTLNTKDYTGTVSGGEWSIDVTAAAAQSLPQGNNTVTADVTDLAGNIATQATRIVTHDSVAPVLAIDAISIDNIINASEDNSAITISGTSTGLEDNQTVSVTVHSKTYTTTVTAGVWTLDMPAADAQALLEGDNNLTVAANDVAGNAAIQVSTTLVHDTNAPTLTIDPISTDSIINALEDDSDVIITGATTGVEDDQDVTVTLNGETYTGAVTNGVWSATLPADYALALPEGVHEVTANVTDLAGNPATSANLDVTHDSVAPTVAFNPITGDNIINASEQLGGITIDGTTSGVENGQTVTVTLNGKDYTDTVTDNAWTVSVPSADTSVLVDNSDYTVSVGVSDLAGNDATVVNQDITVTASPPNAPEFNLQEDTGLNTSDSVTKDATVNVTLAVDTVSWEFRLKLEVDGDGKEVWNTGSGTSFELADDVVYNVGEIQVRQTNTIGNTSNPVANTVKITTDMTPPVAPTFGFAESTPEQGGSTVSSDTGASPTDGISRSSSMQVSGLESGTGIAPSWEYTVNAGTDWTTGTGDSFQLDDGTVLSQTYVVGDVGVRQVDGAGNTSGPVYNTQDIVIDRQVAVATFELENDTGSSAVDNISTDRTMNVILVSDVDSWKYSVDSGNNWITGAGTSFELAADTTYAMGAIQVSQTDIAGNVTSDPILYVPLVSNVVSWEYSLDGVNGTWITGETPDITNPAQPVGSFKLPDEADYAVVDILVRQTVDGVNFLVDPIVSVPSVSDADSWEYSLDSGDTWTAGSGTSFVVGTDYKNYARDAIQVRETIDGTTSEPVTIDVADNVTGVIINIGVGSISNHITKNTTEVVIDNTPPTVTITDDESSTTANIAGGDITYTMTFSEAVTEFTIDDVTVVNATKGTFTAVSGTEYTLVVTPTADFEGNITVDVAGAVAIDAAGNDNTVATQSVQAVDTKAPTSLTIDLIAVDDIISTVEDDGDITISGTTAGVEDDQIVTVTVNSIDYTGIVSTNAWSVTMPAADVQLLPAGTNTITANVTDEAGNPATEATRDVTHGDSTVVIFDTINGVSSDHNGADVASNAFDVNVAYNIYVLVDSNDASAIAMTEAWTDGVNLGSDDKIWLVGNDSTGVVGSDVTIVSSSSSTTTAETWLTTAGNAAVLDANGVLVRDDGIVSSATTVDLWDTGDWTGGAPAVGYIVEMPIELMTSQGLE